MNKATLKNKMHNKVLITLRVQIGGQEYNYGDT